MLAPPAPPRLTRAALSLLPALRSQPFSRAPRLSAASNRIYTNVRNEEDFSNLLLLSSSSRRALITLWTASWCTSCRAVSPLVRELVERHAGGPDDAGVGFAEVELDSPDIAAVAARYMITGVPYLLSFSRGEPQVETAVRGAERMKERKFLEEWIAREARRGGEGGAGGSLFGGLFGGGRGS